MTETEAMVAARCCALLHLVYVEPDDDLLNVGADSLKLIELAIDLEEVFATAVPTDVVARAPRVREIAAWIDANRSTGGE